MKGMRTPNWQRHWWVIHDRRSNCDMGVSAGNGECGRLILQVLGWDGSHRAGHKDVHANLTYFERAFVLSSHNSSQWLLMLYESIITNEQYISSCHSQLFTGPLHNGALLSQYVHFSLEHTPIRVRCSCWAQNKKWLATEQHTDAFPCSRAVLIGVTGGEESRVPKLARPTTGRAHKFALAAQTITFSEGPQY